MIKQLSSLFLISSIALLFIALIKPIHSVDRFGVNIHFTNPKEGVMEELAATGWKWIRMDFVWSAIEKQKGVYDFSAWDTLYSNLEKYDIGAIFILDYTNPLYDNNLSPYTTEGVEAFANWSNAAAGHFKNKKIIFEIYNEPNIKFWKPSPNVTEYIRLAYAVGTAIKKDFPQQKVIAPASSTMDWSFLETCFKGKLLEVIDFVSVHPYRSGHPETVTSDWNKLGGLIAQYGGKNVGKLSSEMGYSELYPNNSALIQSKYLPRELMINIANGAYISIWYDFHNDCTDAKNLECFFGTVENEYNSGKDPVYVKKLSYHSAQTLMSSLDGFDFDKPVIPLVDAGDFVLQFKNSSGKVVLAAWTSNTNHTLTVQGFENLCFDTVDYIGNKGKQICSSSGSMVIPLTDSPLYLKQN